MAAYKAPHLLPEMREFDGLPVSAVHALMRGFSTAAELCYPTGDDVRDMSDRELLALRGFGHRSLAAMRSRFPYRGRSDA